MEVCGRIVGKAIGMVLGGGYHDAQLVWIPPTGGLTRNVVLGVVSSVGPSCLSFVSTVEGDRVVGCVGCGAGMRRDSS